MFNIINELSDVPVVEEPKEMTKVLAVQIIITNARNNNGLVKGIAETVKALESQKAKVVFIANDCDNDEYKKLLTTLAGQYKVPIIEIPEWIELKDSCKLGLHSEIIRKVAKEKNKPEKIKPRCSSACIIDWGEESDAKKFLNL